MFIEQPTSKFQRSVASHNCDLVLAADWIELSVLMFDDSQEGLAAPEITDYLIESQIYDSQDFCAEFVESIFSELRVRQRVGGAGYPLSFDTHSRLSASVPWQDASGLSFCLALSLLPYYSGYTEWVGGNYVVQGQLFEELSVAAFRVWFPDWRIARTGWGGGEGTPLLDLLSEIATHTLEDVRTEAPQFVHESEKDLGLDIAAVRLFADGRPAIPAIFGQCASGTNWTDKLATPDTSRWKQLLTLTHTPLRAFAFPFRLSESQYPRRRSQYKGLLMDRLRLLPVTDDESWIDTGLKQRIVDWLSPRREWLLNHYRAEHLDPV